MYIQIDALCRELRSLRPLSPTELNRLREEFVIETTYNSNAIEGNTLTLRETAMILQEGITIAEKPLRDHLDVIGFRDAFLYMIDLAEQGAELTEKVIRDIHALVLINNAEERGKYRRVPVKILGAHCTPPQPYLVEPKMANLVADYAVWKETSHIIEAIARLHLEFESIHPFIDGNGRTGRIILNLELIKHGLLPVDIKFTDRRRYYDAFDNFAQTGKATALADLIAEYEKEELTRYIDLVKQAQK